MVDNYFHSAVVSLLLQVLLTRPVAICSSHNPDGERNPHLFGDRLRPSALRPWTVQQLLPQGPTTGRFRQAFAGAQHDHRNPRRGDQRLRVVRRCSSFVESCSVVDGLVQKLSSSSVLVGGVNVLIGRWALSCTFSVIVTPSWSRRWNCRVPAR